MKRTTKSDISAKKKPVQLINKSADSQKVVWKYDKIDRNGPFPFDVNCNTEFQHQEFLDKMINYSNMSWTEVKQQTHDNGKSKHHSLQIQTLSKAAQERLRALRLEEVSDTLFSFAFNNTLRIIGMRDGVDFHVLWYDPHHEVCPCEKKHT